jgi:uncharacterized repeat protein (TIGR03803 family)
VEFTGVGGAAPGEAPIGALIRGSDDNFYGTTKLGGVTLSNGTLFRVTPGGELTTLVEFTGHIGDKKGRGPTARLCPGPDGSFYGSTMDGGSDGLGTIFKVTPAGEFTTLFECSYNDDTPRNPDAALLLASDGNFYGAAPDGGEFYGGCVFRMTPQGTVTVLASIGMRGDPFNGSGPVGKLALGGDGNFYGATERGGTSHLGTFYRVSPRGKHEVLASLPYLTGDYIGAFPIDGLVAGADGNFYGPISTFSSQPSSIIRVTPAGGLSTIYSFSGLGSTGTSPETPLALGADGHLYGTTSSGGANGFGTIFRLRTSGLLETLVHFSGTTGEFRGRNPSGAVLTAADGSLYGTTTNGGDFHEGNEGDNMGYGTIYKLAADGTFTTLVKFTNAGPTNMGRYPLGGVVDGGDGYLYGTTEQGGTADFGTIFKITPTGTLTTIAQFTGTSGSVRSRRPVGSLVLRGDGNFYGVTNPIDGVNDGTVYRLSPSGTVTTLHVFEDTSIDGPTGGLTVGPEGDLYGTYRSVGGGAGAVYRLHFGPIPVTQNADLVTATSARLNATVNPNGFGTVVSFEWGETPALGQVTTPQIVSAGLNPVTVTATLGNIAPANTTYFYRIKTINSEGTRYGETLSIPGATPFAQWKLAHLGDAAASDVADPDDDGFATLAEYGTNTLPGKPDPAALPPPVAFDYAEGRRLRLLLTRDPARNDVTLEVQAASRIAGPWSTIATSTLGAPFSGPGYVGGDDPGPGMKTVEIRDTVNLSGSPTRFLRLRVTR